MSLEIMFSHVTWLTCITFFYMQCYGSCHILRGVGMDVSDARVAIHLRTDARNLLAAASTAALPAREETMRMIHMVEKGCAPDTLKSKLM